MTSDNWSSIEHDGLPDFRLWGFHTNRRLRVKYSDGTEGIVHYMGYGMFGKDNREDVTDWQPDLETA